MLKFCDISCFSIQFSIRCCYLLCVNSFICYKKYMFKRIIYAKISQIFRPCKIFIPLSCYYKALLTTEIVKFLSTYILHISSRWYAHGCSEIARYIIYIIDHKFQIISYISLYFVVQRTNSCNCQITVSILSISNYHLSIHRI